MMQQYRNLGANLFPMLMNLLPLAGTLRSGRRARIPQYGQRPSNVGTARRGRNLRRFGNGQTRRRRNLDGRSGMEINRAEGGYKGVFQDGKYITQSIDMYDGINLASRTFVAPSAYSFDGNSPYLDISTMLSQNQEFLALKTIAFKYRVTGIRLSFDYSTVVPSLTSLSKLILTPETDLIEVDEPLINKASMVLSMSRMGVKNYWFNLNKGNMKEENVDWIDAGEEFYGRLRIHISGQGQNNNPLEESIKLGILKISVIVRYVQRDVASVALQNIKKQQRIQLQIPPIAPLVREEKIELDVHLPQKKEPPGVVEDDSKSFGAPDLDVLDEPAKKDDRQDQINQLVNKINDLRIDLNALQKAGGKDG